MASGSDEFLYDVRCATCTGLLGVSATRKYGMFHDALCAWDMPVSQTEQRDAVIEAMIRDMDIAHADIARMFGFSRQRLYQLRFSRDIRNLSES